MEVFAKTDNGEFDRGLVPGSFWRHFKGGIYQLIDVATHTETKEELVIYQSMFTSAGKPADKHLIWARPKEMFLSPVDRAKYPKADQPNRLMKIVYPVFKDETEKPEVGQYINKITWNFDHWEVWSAKITNITQTLHQTTIYTSKNHGFYPLKTSEHDFAPNSKFPEALADFYFGSPMTVQDVEELVRRRDEQDKKESEKNE